MHIPRELIAHQFHGVLVYDRRVIPLEEEEIPALVVDGRHLSLQDPVGIGDDIALQRLAEDLAEHDRSEDTRFDQVPQHSAGAYAGQLVHVPHQDQSRAGHDCLEKRAEQVHVHHGHLVDDDGVRFQRIVPVFVKIGIRRISVPVPQLRSGGKGVLAAFGHSAHAQKAMDRHRLKTCCLCHSFGGPSCGRCQKDAEILAPEIADDRVDRRRLAGAGSTRYDQDRMLRRHEDRLSLQRVQFYIFFSFQCFQHFLGLPGSLTDRFGIQFRQHSRDLLLLPPGRDGVDLDLLALSAYFDPPLHCQVVQLNADQLFGHLQELGSSSDQDLLGKVGAAFRQSRGKCIEQPAPYAELRLRADPGFGRDLVRRGESYAVDVLGQLVGIVPKDRVHLRVVGLPDLERYAVRDAELLQKEHGVPQVAFLSRLRRDLTRFPLADALDLRQSFRLLVHDPERLAAESLDDPGSQRLSDALDGTGREVAQDRFLPFRRDHAIGLHLELLAVNGMLHCFARHDAALPLTDGKGIAGAGQKPVLAVDFEYGICVFLVPVNDMFYISLVLFHPCGMSFQCPSICVSQFLY